MFVLDDSAEKTKAYLDERGSPAGRTMFIAADEISPQAAFLSIPDPVKNQARIAAAVKAGFIVTTRADSDAREARQGKTERRDAAFASGAQIVQTNFPAADPAIGSYRVSLADNAEAMCGKRLAPEQCVRLEEPPPRTAIAAAVP